MRACEHCGAELVRGEREHAANFRKRRFCGRDCVAGGIHRQILPWHAEAEAMWREGVPTAGIAETLGVTKNVVIGLAQRREWPPHPLTIHPRASPSTLFTRLDAIHAKFDALMEELKHGPALPRSVLEPVVGRLR